MGNGKQTRDFTYVLDVVDAIIKSMNSKIKNEIFNIGSSNTYSVNYLVSLLSKNKTYIPKRPDSSRSFASYLEDSFTCKVGFEFVA